MTKHSLAAEAATVREGRGRSAATSRPGCCSSAATQQFRMLHRSPGGTVGPRCRRTGEGGNIFIGGAAPRIRLQRGQHSCTRGARGGNETPRWRRGRRAARSTAMRRRSGGSAAAGASQFCGAAQGQYTVAAAAAVPLAGLAGLRCRPDLCGGGGMEAPRRAEPAYGCSVGSCTRVARRSCTRVTRRGEEFTSPRDALAFASPRDALAARPRHSAQGREAPRRRAGSAAAAQRRGAEQGRRTVSASAAQLNARRASAAVRRRPGGAAAAQRVAPHTGSQAAAPSWRRSAAAPAYDCRDGSSGAHASRAASRCGRSILSPLRSLRDFRSRLSSARTTAHAVDAIRGSSKAFICYLQNSPPVGA